MEHDICHGSYPVSRIRSSKDDVFKFPLHNDATICIMYTNFTETMVESILEYFQMYDKLYVIFGWIGWSAE